MTPSERWGPLCRASGEEAALAARVCSVRALWSPRPRTPSPPPPSRKMRARRRQPRRLTQSPLTYCLETPAPLLCDPSCKFQFEPPRPPQLSDCQRAIGHLSVSVQAVMRASANRCQPYRGTNVSRYAPTSQRPARGPDRRYGVWWPRDHPSPRLENRFRLTQPLKKEEKIEPKEVKPETEEESKEETVELESDELSQAESSQPTDNIESASSSQQDSPAVDNPEPSTSTASDTRKKRLYSTVLSMSAPAPINLAQVRLSQKLAPGLLKLNPKIVLPAARIRNANVDNKFEELEKEALEQYKGSDESIDTKFRELEKQAVEQYSNSNSNSNSNTSCSSGNSTEKKPSPSPPAPEADDTKKSPTKFHKEKSVDSVTIYSQNFPDPKGNKNQTTSVTNLKNSHTPPRGEKKEQAHRPCKNSRGKSESQKAASDTDYEAREANFKGSHKGPMRWTLHVVPPKKRHLNLSVSDCSSDDELMKEPVPRIAKQNCSTGKTKLSEHGGGDLNILRTT